LLVYALILGSGRVIQTLGDGLSRPEVSYRLQRVESDLKIERRGSPLLARGFVIILQKGRPQAWKCLVKIRRGGNAKVVKRLRCLDRGKAWRFMTGKGSGENPIPFPRVTALRTMLEVEATAYDPGPVDSKRGYVGTTSLGLRAHFGIVAVDPKIIPYRSRLWVEGYGVGLAGDTGGAIKGPRVDLCFDSTRQARLYGRRRTRAYLLESVGRKESAVALKRLGL
jgi:3D (Asp-Asp-Asp) domain-containing protein